MAITGKRKAALLLMNLDAITASEIIKGLGAEEIQEVAVELSELEANGVRDSEEGKRIVKDFYTFLKESETTKLSVKSFLGEMLEDVLGEEKAQQVRSQIKEVTEKRDPFLPMRSASVDELVLALEGEHEQTIAVVLSELDTEKGQKVLSHLDEKVRLKTVFKMTNLEMVRSEVRRRIATTVANKLKDVKGETLPEGRQQNLRKLAVVLSGLEQGLRDKLLEEVEQKDEETCKMIRDLMITWDDLLYIADRSLQEAMRSAETKMLALALFGADDAFKQKIVKNISERAAETLDEEISLMQEPLDSEVLEAREEIIKPLREANEKGKLRIKKR